jgi:hypothetical protein
MKVTEAFPESIHKVRQINGFENDLGMIEKLASGSFFEQDLSLFSVARLKLAQVSPFIFSDTLESCPLHRELRFWCAR